jgi:gamma-glutamyltranspeptidase/glutathione hydrolase
MTGSKQARVGRRACTLAKFANTTDLLKMIPTRHTTALALVLAVVCGCGPSRAASRDTTAATPAPSRLALRPARVATADSAMVVSASALATNAGLDVLRHGGNAVDAAVTVALTLAVTYPAAGNIGGGGFMVARINGKNVALDFREIAPRAATRDMYLDAAGNMTDKSVTGALAAGVPGSVAGLYEAHRKYGSKPWAELVRPAMELAEKGFVLDTSFSDDDEGGAARLTKDSASATLFLRNGKFVPVGDTWRAPELAAVLRRIAERGRDGFYKGETADLIVAAMKKGGGIISHQDLAGYQAIWRTPVEFTYRGHPVVSMPPVSSGGLTLELILGILERSKLDSLGWRSPGSIHLLAEAERRAFARRNTLLGDPGFVKIPVASFTSKDTAAALLAEIGTMSSGSSGGVAAKEPRHTTHFSIVDAHGNAVAITTTLNESYGAAFTVPGAQFLLNDEMDDFTGKVGAVNAMGLVQGATNAIAPGKRMLSSMTPTIVLDSSGAPLLVTGAAGGAYIITTVAHQIVSLFDYHKSLGEAMAAPQFHHQDVPDSLIVEQVPWADSAAVFMKPLGHAVKLSPWGSLANAQSIHREDGKWRGVTEPRGYGLAKGY